MNNIYKVIWSKAKNCYVVASEIARSHTKSASGSEKIGGGTRRKLLASLMALSLLCGGLGVAEAAVHVVESGVTYEVLTTQEVTAELDKKVSKETADAKYAKATDVATNTADIGTNKDNIKSLQDKKLDITTANATYATNDALNTLQSAVNDKVDESTLTTALDGKANTDLSNLTADGETKIKNIMSEDMALKANKAEVNAALDGKADKATVTDLATKVGDASSGLVNDVATLKTKVGDDSHGLVRDVAELRTQGTTLNNALGDKADKSDLETAKAKITTNESNIAALKTKTANLSDDGTALNGMTTVETDALKVTGAISDGAGVNTTLADINDSMTQTATNKDDIATLQTTTNNQQTAIDGLNTKTTQISYDPAKGTTVNDVEFKAAEVDANGKGLTGVSTLNTTGAATIGGALTAAGLDAGTGAITGGSLSVTGEVKGNRVDAGAGEIKTTGVVNAGTLSTAGNATVGGELNATGKVSGKGLDAGTEAITGGSLSVTGEVKGNRVDAGAGEIKTTGVVNAGTLSTAGNATVGGELNATGKVSGKGLDAGTGDITGGSLTVTGAVKGNGVDAGAGEIKTTGAVNAGTLSTTGNATVGGDLSAKNTEITGTLHATGETMLDDKLTVTGEAAFKDKVTMDKDLEVKGELKTDKITMEHKETKADGTRYDSSTTITADSITHFGEVEKSGVITKSQFTHTEEGSETYAKKGDATDWTETRSDVKADGVKTEVKDSKKNRTNTSQTADGIKGYATDEKGNKTYTKVTATENSFQVQDKDGKNKNHQVNTKDSSVTEITNGDGKTTKTEQTATDIINTAKDGTIKNEANHIENTATTMKTTVTGQATEEFNGGLDTTVAGTEKHTVNGKQINTVTEGQENIISGGQTNTITGGQTNNITGDQTTTITGNKTETVTENVTEDYKKDLTTTVGGNEIHEVKGTKTETVEGKVTETFKGGQETYVTGDQTTNVSGTQTTTATDINRNASSGMIDTVENASGSNKETKVAGQTTTDVKLASGEEGHYIRGATESRDYLLNGTLKNSETKTAEATSSEVTDGTNKASTIQDAKNLAGSVTNGTETGISGIHANNDGSVSIDSTVVGGGMSSVINQKKDSIQSVVGDGTNSTVIRQDKDNVAIASSNGTVAIAGKDIVNNASNSITDKVGDNTRVTTSTSITDTVGTANRKIENGKIIDTANDSTVTTENGKGTTFTKTGSTAYSTAAGAPTDTNIAGNHITTGRVDANELGVSDKDGANTADFSVEAGERKGVKASAGNGTTTGSLDVTAEEVSSSVKDASGKGSTFKQRIDAIMMESKEVSIKAEETLTNEAKVITNKASEVINNEAVNINNTATGIINSKASEIKNQADKLISNKVGENTSEYMEDGKITTSVKDGAKSTVTIQNADGLQTGVTNGTSTNASATTATSSAQTIASGNKANSVITTIDGTQFVNTDAAVPVTGASGAGTAVNTTIKGNTITTGKVTMDYADVMKDLGVRGNANITGKTTTGSLEVTGTSTLKGDVTMENNATVGNNLTVNGTTKTKTLNVTENAEVGGELKVAKKATFEDSVSIAKDLTVGGDVTAKSYKVGDKTYISADGINANDQKITNVADGSISEGSKDAVNGGQLYQVKNDLEGKVNKVGANAAAMANLHPMEFDPDSKWNIAAAIGNYGSETAAALGAFYRPNDNVMVNLSTAFGTGENMVGGGVSVRLGKGGNKLSREETNALKAQVADLSARMDALLSVLNPNMSKDFPDVPENHWAYEAVSRLAGNDIVQGYPDGEFHGDRTMTRYEMAEIIYNALSRGAEAEKELVEEFKPELQAMAASEKATVERAEG